MQEQVLLDTKVLVINDSKEITAALAEVFTNAGARVTESHRGTDAMQYVAWGGYDLIFVHLSTAEREKSGILEFIAQSRPELLRRTVVLAGDQMDTRAQARLQYRYCACLVLPFLPKSLLFYAVRALAFSEQRCAV